MQYYMAPLEGITTYIFRNVYHRHYRDCDRYFTPFLASKKLSWKEVNEIKPENNEGYTLIPQILSNNVETFLNIAEQLRNYGYDTVNLNLGCPSGTVVSKKRGAGQLGDTYALDRFLEEIFEKCSAQHPMKISIKTRVGMCDTCEWEDILAVYSKYPLEELIIHPRLREDYYSGKPRLETFEQAVAAKMQFPICYNGDITSRESMDDIINRFPDLDRVMIGRGILRKPWIVEELAGMKSVDEVQGAEMARLKDFMSDLADSYERLYGPGQDQNALFKLKDVWNHLGLTFTDADRELKAIRKANSLSEYRISVKRFFAEKELG